MLRYERRMPHEIPEGQPLFLTFCLHGSLPHARYPPPGRLKSGKVFVWMDRYLDTTRRGPQYLKQAPIAEIVVNALLFAQNSLKFFDLDAYVVMSNHVHLLVDPKAPPSQFLKSIKNFSARKANKLLGLSGNPFWQSESYDHWVRNEKERGNIKSYIENNPVKAGLVQKAEEYRWSSAYRRGAE